MQRKQTTSAKEGWPPEGRVELGEKAGAPSISPASQGRRDDRPEVKEDLLERVLSKDNLNLAYKRVKANKGSPGVDGMTVEELLPYRSCQGSCVKFPSINFLREGRL